MRKKLKKWEKKITWITVWGQKHSKSECIVNLIPKLLEGITNQKMCIKNSLSARFVASHDYCHSRRIHSQSIFIYFTESYQNIHNHRQLLQKNDSKFIQTSLNYQPCAYPFASWISNRNLNWFKYQLLHFIF